MSMEIVLKKQPSDFRVREVLVPPLAPRSASAVEYVSLTKVGFTTMEAVRVLANTWGICSSDIRYGGLKDEDGITDQLLSLPIPEGGPTTWDHDADSRSIQVRHQGYGVEALSIGVLEGNAFRVLARNLPPEVAEHVAERRKFNFFFLNYYDTQRFGVPGGVPRTHEVGRAVLEGRWDEALAELAGLRAPESPGAAGWSGPAASYFAELDERTTSFYLAAHVSAGWNEQLRTAVQATIPECALTRTVQGIPYTFSTSLEGVRRVLAAAPELPLERLTFADGSIERRPSERPAVIQTQIQVGRSADDDLHPGRSCLEFRFMLPSGCYATTVLRQLFEQLDFATDLGPAEVVGG